MENNIGIIDFFDGASYQIFERSTKISTIINFNSTIFGVNSVDKSNTTAGSRNILTWKQMLGNENYANVSEAIEDEYNERQSLINEYNLKHDCQIYQYHMHDGKMLYLITQHSMWNRKHYPFLMCKCKRGVFLKQTPHVNVLRKRNISNIGKDQRNILIMKNRKIYHTLLNHTEIGLMNIILDALILECIRMYYLETC